MQAWVTSEDHSLRLAEVEEPRPADDELLVEVVATSLNRGEVRLIDARSAGFIPGLDVAGIVSKEAADGSGPPVGSRVIGITGKRCGGWARRAALSTACTAKIPDELAWTDAAALPTAGMTALRALSSAGSLLGCRALVTGVTGGVGRLTAQLAIRAGAIVAGTVRSAERADTLRGIALADIFVGNSAVGRFDLIVDTLGGEALTHAFEIIDAGGVIATVGGQPGFDAPRQLAIVPAGWFATHPGARLIALNVLWETVRHGTGVKDLKAISTLAARGELDPGVTRLLKWEELAYGVQQFRAGRLRGKCVVRFDAQRN
jgi:NADPH2:quinone reductase